MLTTIFCKIDDFCKSFEKQFSKNCLTSGKNIRNRSCKLTLSEIMTISTYYHFSCYKSFKNYYEKQVLEYMHNDFKNLVSYNRFLELRSKALLPLLMFMLLQSMKESKGISFIDSFPLKVSNIKRISSHKVFKNIAAKGKTSVGWFYGFKLHLIINHLGEIVSFCITPGNVADNNKSIIVKLTKNIYGKIFGDRGYILNKDLFQKLYSNGKEFVTKIRKNMKNCFMNLQDKLLLRKRGIIESVGKVLKEDMSLCHSRHRSIFGFFVHIISTLVAYNFRPKKPSIAKLVAIA